MARFTTNLSMTTPTDTITAVKSGNFEDAVRLTQSVDNSDTPILLVTGSADKGVNSINNAKSIMIKNSGAVGAELRIQFETWTAGTPDSNGNAAYYSQLLGAGDFVFLPNIKQCGYSTAQSAANAAELDNAAPDGNMYKIVQQM